jgi:hypothetical protein
MTTVGGPCHSNGRTSDSKKAMQAQFGGRRSVKRPRGRWEDAVRIDADRLTERQLRETGKNGERSVRRPGPKLGCRAI